MIKVTIGNNLSRKSVIIEETTTLRTGMPTDTSNISNYMYKSYVEPFTLVASSRTLLYEMKYTTTGPAPTAKDNIGTTS